MLLPPPPSSCSTRESMMPCRSLSMELTRVWGLGRESGAPSELPLAGLCHSAAKRQGSQEGEIPHPSPIPPIPQGHLSLHPREPKPALHPHLPEDPFQVPTLSAPLKVCQPGRKRRGAKGLRQTEEGSGPHLRPPGPGRAKHPPAPYWATGPCHPPGTMLFIHFASAG